MIKFLKILLLSLLAPIGALAQNGTTTIQAIVKDPTGALYVSSQVGASFYDPGTPGKLPLLNGSTFQKSYTGYGTDSFGFFTLTLPDNGVIDSSSGTVNTQWNFTICYKDRQTCFTYRTAINCAANLPTTCSSNTIDISAILQAIAALLPTTGGGGSPAQGPLYTVQASNGAGQFQVTTITDNIPLTQVTIGDNLLESGTLTVTGSSTLNNSLTVNSTTSITGKLTVGGDAQFGGLNPYVDVRKYGVRPVTSVPSTTASISSGSANATLGSASSFVNGDGIVIYGAGPTNTMTTPSAPTVTPILVAGALRATEVVNSSGGASTCNYQIVARNKNGALTPASSVGSTATCVSTLGSNVVAVTSAARANNVVTVTTSAAHGMVVGAAFYFSNSTDSTFEGPGLVVTVPDSTHFTFVQGYDTREGATTSDTGGAVTSYNGNRLTWTAVTGAIEYYIYGRSGGSLTFIGTSTPLELVFDDYGSTIMGVPFRPSYVSNTPPVSAINEPLVTRILSGAGTTSVTLANTASNTVVAASSLFDDGVNLVIAKAAVAGAPLYFPSDINGGTYVFNSYTNLTANSANGTAILQAGELTLNETMELPSGVVWHGDMGGLTGYRNSFDWTVTRPINIKAFPGLWFNNIGGAGSFIGLGFRGGSFDQELLVLVDGIAGFAQFSFNNCTFSTGSGSSFDVMGIAYEVRAGTLNMFEHVTFDSALDNGGGTPLGLWAGSVYSRGGLPGNNNTAGSLWMKNTTWTPRGIVVDTTLNFAAVGGYIDGIYSQGARSPLVLQEEGFGGTLPSVWRIANVAMDTTTAPIFASMGGVAQSLILDNIFDSTSYPWVAGNPIGNLQILGASGNVPNTGVIAGPYFSNSAATVYGNGAFQYGLTTNISAPGVAVSAGGAVPIGTIPYSIQFLDINGNYSQVSTTANAVTTTGNQTVTLTRPTVPAGMVSWVPYRNGAASTCSPIAVGTTTFVDTGFNCGQSTRTPLAGVSMISSAGLSSPTLTLVNNGFTSSTDFPTLLTANRTLHIPNATGTLALLEIAQTWTLAQTFSAKAVFNAAQSTTFTDFPTSTTPGNPSSGNVRIYGDSGSGNLTCLTSTGASCLPAGGAGTPGGSSTQVQVNVAGSFAGNVNFTYTSPALSLGSAAGATGQLKFVGLTSGIVTLQSQDIAGTWTFKLPINAGTSNFPLITDGSGNSSWTLLPVAGGGTGAATFTSNQLLLGNGTGALQSLVGSLTGTNPVLTLTAGSASAVPLAVNTASSPTGDVFQVLLNSVKTSWFDASAFLHTPQTLYTGIGPLTLSGTEGTCGAVLSGADIICLGDSSTHDAQLSVNGGPFKPMVQSSTGNPTAFGVTGWSNTFPQLVASGAGTTGQAFLSAGAAAFGNYGALNLAGGATIFTGILPPANGGTGAASLAAANIMVGSGAFVLGNCLKSGGANLVVDQGTACGGGGGSPPLNTVVAATASSTINNTVFTERFNYALTGSMTGFIFGENTAATGSNNIILQVTTNASSTAKPFQVDNNGNGVSMSTVGFFTSKGTGGTDSNMSYCDVTDVTKCAKLVLSGITTATTRNITVPDAASTIVVSDTGASNNFLTAISASGAISKAQPSFSNLSSTLLTTQMVALTGDVTNSTGAVATTIAANAVTAAKSAVVLTRRTCAIVIGSDNGAILANADIAPQLQQCQIPYAATVVEIDVRADAGTPNVIVAKRHCTASACTVGANETVSDLTSSALAAGTAGAAACSNAGGTAGLDTFTTCSATLQNTSLAIGDYIETHSATAGGTAKRMTILVHYTVN